MKDYLHEETFWIHPGQTSEFVEHFFQTYMLRREIITHVTIFNMFWYSIRPRLPVMLIPYSCGALYKIRSISPQVID